MELGFTLLANCNILPCHLDNSNTIYEIDTLTTSVMDVDLITSRPLLMDLDVWDHMVSESSKWIYSIFLFAENQLH
jgi:hypothetical protein